MASPIERVPVHLTRDDLRGIVKWALYAKRYHGADLAGLDHAASYDPLLAEVRDELTVSFDRFDADPDAFPGGLPDV